MDQELMIMNNMKRLGFSEYESKAYLALLKEYPLNGYTLAKNSGIPRSRIYEVLKNLINKQLVLEEEEGKNKFYYPVDPDIFIKRLKSDFDGIFENISRFAKDVYEEKKEDDRLVVIKGRTNIIDFLKLLIKGAEKRIALSIWDEEISELRDDLKKAIKKGVMLRGIYFGENNTFQELVPHRRIKRYMAEKKERYISIIIDGTHTISGIASRGESSKVTWTREEGFIEISEDYIAHDLLVNLYSASLDEEGYKDFEEFADNVHNHFFGYSSEELGMYKQLK